MKFAITCLGRSGSKSLARKLAENTNGYMVCHERENDIASSPLAFNARSEKVEKYGEVNGYLQSVLMRINADKRAVILRNPIECFLSGLNRRKYLDPRQLANHINNGAICLDFCIRNGAKIIWFDKMISSEEYRQMQIYSWLGLGCAEGFPWIDKTAYSRLMLKEDFDECVSRFDWFVKKYFPEYYEEENHGSD